MSAAADFPLYCADPVQRSQAQALAARWGFALAEGAAKAPCLCLGSGRLALHVRAGEGMIAVDFTAGAAAHRRRFGGGREQAIAKAVGLKRGANPSVIDATAGLGRDGFVLATLGCRVTLIERSPLVAALLEDGLMRGAQDADTAPILARMNLLHGDAQTLLNGHTADVVYLDPMYPQRQKSAQVKKEMRAFRDLLGEDADADRLLAAALRCARGRVVVKRPDYAEPLAGQRPSMSITTKNHRFDVYVKEAMQS